MLTLIIGGARSGKSDLATRLAAASRAPVLVLATMQPGDDEMRARIEAHRAARPAAWRTVEEPLRVVDALRDRARAGDTVILDCLTLWVSNLLIDALPGPDEASIEALTSACETAVEMVGRLAMWTEGHAGDVIVVSNEVGLGLVPPYPLGRVFRDALGAANRVLAERAGRVYATVAGLAVELKALGAVPLNDAAGPPPA
jgi:adenosylcobinamide kinase/adenosylcobinamide-phosphate guanylyltransferase